MMKKTLFTIALTLLLGLNAWARPGSAWLEVGPGGRAAALAEAVTASVEGATATYWNPAALSTERHTIEFMQNNWWVEGGSSQYVAGSFPLSPRLVMGASAMHVGIGDMELRDGPSSAPLGSFDSRNYSLGLSAAYMFTAGVRAGASVHYLSESIYTDHATGWSADLGLLRPGLLGGALDLGAAIRHLGEIDALRTEAYDLPMTVSAGALYRLKDSGTIQPRVMVEAVKVYEYDPELRAGLEVGLFEYLALRGGIQSGVEGRLFSAGFGLQYNQWRFDYGYTPFREDLGNAQRISAGIVW